MNITRSFNRLSANNIGLVGNFWRLERAFALRFQPFDVRSTLPANFPSRVECVPIRASFVACRKESVCNSFNFESGAMEQHFRSFRHVARISPKRSLRASRLMACDAHGA